MADPKPEEPPCPAAELLAVPWIQDHHTMCALPEAWGLVLGGRKGWCGAS